MSRPCTSVRYKDNIFDREINFMAVNRDVIENDYGYIRTFSKNYLYTHWRFIFLWPTFDGCTYVVVTRSFIIDFYDLKRNSSRTFLKMIRWKIWTIMFIIYLYPSRLVTTAFCLVSIDSFKSFHLAFNDENSGAQRVTMILFRGGWRGCDKDLGIWIFYTDLIFYSYIYVKKKN